MLFEMICYGCDVFIATKNDELEENTGHTINLQNKYFVLFNFYEYKSIHSRIRTHTDT